MNIPKLPFKYSLLGIAAGAGIGAYADDDNRNRGALIGAATSVGLLTGIRGFQNWKAATVVPALWKATPKISKGVAALGIAGAAGAAYSAYSNPSEDQAGYTTSPDGEGGYSKDQVYQNYQYSLSDRIASMNVSGDLVFGLHNKRHG
jgi:hypothetical protein